MVMAGAQCAGFCYTYRMDKQKKFSIKERVFSFRHAFRGIGVVCKTQHNIWIHIIVAVIVVVLGFHFCISTNEWLALVMVIGLVFICEFFNTALEVDMNLTSPDFHPFAKDTKDIAAGAVLVSAIVALVVGCIIFVPRLLLL